MLLPPNSAVHRVGSNDALLTPAVIAEELRRGHASWQLAPPTLPARLHSLRALVGQSWQLLSEDERRKLEEQYALARSR